MDTKVAVIGLGYVGLPLALAFSRKFPGTIGFDIDSDKVAQLNKGIDVNCEGFDKELKLTKLKITANKEDLRSANFFIIGVPTPVDQNKNPDLGPLKSACQIVGSILGKGSTIVFESTVYPGVTEEFCAPILEQASALVRGRDFKLGYSPERINPGDAEHTLEGVIKVVSGEDQETLEKVAKVYSEIVKAGVYKASSIKVAEAAKVIENTQRDLNIALVNELSIIFDLMNISTKEVLQAAATKWNFVRFNPGLVGGHCIGVDPYYLTSKAQSLGYHPQVILAGRRINDDMGKHVAQKTVKLMIHAGIQIKGARVGVLGLTFKENVSDIRNSRVPDIVNELQEFGIKALIHEPNVSCHKTKEEYGLDTLELSALNELDALILAVSHRQFLQLAPVQFWKMMNRPGVFVDVKSVIDPQVVPQDITYWSL